LCYGTNVAVKVIATDAIMRALFDEPYEGCP